MERSAATPPSSPASPSSLSPSRAADFLQCPLLYRFRVIDKLPEEPNPAATRGTVVHAVLERVFDAPPEERVPSRARTLVAQEWQRLLAKRPELARLFHTPEGGGPGAAEEGGEATGGAGPESGSGGGADTLDGPRLAGWLAEAEALVERWFTLEDPARLEPAERELFVETKLTSGLRLRGVIDRVDIAPTGEVRIVDYKTGRAPRAEHVAEALFQMRFYALVLWRLRGTVPRRLQLVYLGSGDILTHDPDEADLWAVERKLLALWQAIRRATESGDWRPSRSRLCDWCNHQAHCPEFGGTPPPYPLASLCQGETSQPGPPADLPVQGGQEEREAPGVRSRPGAAGHR